MERHMNGQPTLSIERQVRTWDHDSQHYQ